MVRISKWIILKVNCLIVLTKTIFWTNFVSAFYHNL